MKITNIINAYMEVIVFDRFLYEYICDPGKAQKKGLDWHFPHLPTAVKAVAQQ